MVNGSFSEIVGEVSKKLLDELFKEKETSNEDFKEAEKETPSENLKDEEKAERLEVEEFSNENLNDVFTTEKLIELFCALLVFGDLSKGTTGVISGQSDQEVPKAWFMPTLLPSLCKICLRKHCQQTYDNLVGQTMAVHFPPCGPQIDTQNLEGPQNGLFCALGSYLCSPAQPNWEISRVNGKPRCLKSNCMEFDVGEFVGTVTIIDYFKFFVIHVLTREDELKKIWKTVWEVVIAGLEHASNIIGYHNNPKCAIFCPHNGGIDHLATLRPDKEVWRCSIDSTKTGEVKFEDYSWTSPFVGESVSFSLPFPSVFLIFHLCPFMPHSHISVS